MRPRKKDRHLPSCVFLKSGSYYYVKRNKWERLADNSWWPHLGKCYEQV